MPDAPFRVSKGPCPLSLPSDSIFHYNLLYDFSHPIFHPIWVCRGYHIDLQVIYEYWFPPIASYEHFFLLAMTIRSDEIVI